VNINGQTGVMLIELSRHMHCIKRSCVAWCWVDWQSHRWRKWWFHPRNDMQVETCDVVWSPWNWASSWGLRRRGHSAEYRSYSAVWAWVNCRYRMMASRRWWQNATRLLKTKAGGRAAFTRRTIDVVCGIFR